MFLYNIPLGLNSDNQLQVDAFIRSRVPSVSQSPSAHPKVKAKGVTETVYTRLLKRWATGGEELHQNRYVGKFKIT